MEQMRARQVALGRDATVKERDAANASKAHIFCSFNDTAASSDDRDGRVLYLQLGR